MGVRLGGRHREWLRRLELVEMFAEKVSSGLGGCHGHPLRRTARGDWKKWIGIDLIIVSPAFQGIRPLDRFELYEPLVEDGIETVPMTPEEFMFALRNPAWRKTLLERSYIVRDDLGLGGVVRRVLGVRIPGLEELRRTILEGLETETI